MNEMDKEVDRIRQDMVLRGEPLPMLATSMPLQVKDLTDRMKHVQAVIKSVMRVNVHYGVIPGTKKRTLLKEGSEILLSTFHISVDPEVEDLSSADVVRYRVRCVGKHIGTGTVVGFGLGSCSSNEDKYKWRAPVCDAEFEETDPARRREKWFKGNGNPYKAKQVRTNPEEVANTILKMAKKRAQIDLTLTALAASDAFSEGAIGAGNGGPTPEELRRQTRGTDTSKRDTEADKPETKGATTATNGASGATDAPRPATSAQLGLLKRKLDQSGVPENHFFAQFEIGTFEQLPFGRVDEALKWIADLVDPA
jgi:hypothetical protein